MKVVDIIQYHLTKKAASKKNGFTYLELIVVLLLLGIFFVSSLVSFDFKRISHVENKHLNEVIANEKVVRQMMADFRSIQRNPSNNILYKNDGSFHLMFAALFRVSMRETYQSCLVEYRSNENDFIERYVWGFCDKEKKNPIKYNKWKVFWEEIDVKWLYDNAWLDAPLLDDIPKQIKIRYLADKYNERIVVVWKNISLNLN